MSPPRWSPGLDRAIGIGLGVALGIGIVTSFVFLGSEETIDAPRVGADQPPEVRSSRARSVPTVRVIGGAPPPSGPVRLEVRAGRRVRFRIVTDSEIRIAVPGYGVNRTVPAGTSVVSFRTRRIGQFPVIVAGSRVGIAALRVLRRP